MLFLEEIYQKFQIIRRSNICYPGEKKNLIILIRFSKINCFVKADKSYLLDFMMEISYVRNNLFIAGKPIDLSERGFYSSKKD